MRLVSRILITFSVLVFLSAPFRPGLAQTANTAVVLGTVTDIKGGTVPGAQIDLINTATNESRTTPTNEAGQYVFPSVVPGKYTLKITKQSFAVVNFANVTVSVAKSYTYDVTLEIKTGIEVIEVTAASTAELQTTDAVVGCVVGGSTLMHLPTLQRDNANFSRSSQARHPTKPPMAAASATRAAPLPAPAATRTPSISTASTSPITSSPEAVTRSPSFPSESKAPTSFALVSPTITPASAAPPVVKST